MLDQGTTPRRFDAPGRYAIAMVCELRFNVCACAYFELAVFFSLFAVIRVVLSSKPEISFLHPRGSEKN